MNGLLELLRAERLGLFEATAAHLDLVLEATVAAAVIGIPLGVLASRSRPAETVVLGVANVLQTVPSLALLGFLLIAFRGTIGKPPALAALVVYALLPIIKNTVLGLRGVDPGVNEAARGLGMTPWQRLRLVELPLAVPNILGGVRVAVVASFGMATIAAAIWARGLGSYIFRGIALSEPNLILLGAIPSAVLALGCDAALGEVEHGLDPRRPSRSRGRVALAGAAILLLLGVGLWGAWLDARVWLTGERPVVIGAKDSTEPILLGRMLADLVASETGRRAEVRVLGGSLVCYNALKHGGIDAYVEYTGTALTAILHEDPRNDPDAVLALVRRLCLERDGVEVLDPIGFENTFAVLMRREQAERLGIRTISDLRGHAEALRAGFGPEFMNRPDGFPGLVAAYGLAFGPRVREMDRNLLYDAVALGSIDVAAGDSTDGRIAALDLVVLEDDRRYFPPYQAVPLVSGLLAGREPAVALALGRLAGRIDAATMRRLNFEVDGRRRDPAAVARAFLDAEGLLPDEAP